MRYKQLVEGVRIGKKEIEETLKHSQDFQMGIEYEFLTPNALNRVQEANDFIQQYNITHVDKVIIEHDDMMEIVTKRMDIVDGLKHIKHFFKSSKQYGITFPEMAGMHISISHKNADSANFNYAKFIVLLSGDYLHSIFPERQYVKNISNQFKEFLSKTKPKTVKEVEENINELMNSGDDEFVSRKYITAKLSDYEKHDGRIELRFFGGKNYDAMYNDMRTQLLRAIYILSIALDNGMYRKEYLKQLGKLITQSNDLDAKDAFDILRNNKVSPSKRKELENIIATDATFSIMYAEYVIKGRFEKGEDVIAKNAIRSYEYAEYIKGRFEKGESAIASNNDLNVDYAINILNGRFKEAEEYIANNASNSYKYASRVLKKRFKKGEEAIIDHGEYIIAYASDVIQGRFKEAEDKLAQKASNSYLYAKDVIKSRFKEGEETIINDKEYIVPYASKVIKGRFEEAEDVIKENPHYSVEYAEKVIKGRFKDAEETIMQTPQESYMYATKVIKGRFKEAEDVIMNHKEVAFHYLGLVSVTQGNDDVMELMKKYLDGIMILTILQKFINNDNLDIEVFKDYVKYRYSDNPKESQEIIDMINDLYGL